MPVELIGLGHRFPGGPWLFEELTATVETDEVVALVGPSGSGKSTLLSIIAGWLAPAAGQVRLSDIRKVNWVFQNPHGVAQRSALDHVAVGLLARGAQVRDAEEQAAALLADFALSDVAKRPFAQLSGGEAQRLMLARALASSPDLLLVDEPTAQLDQHTAKQVADQLTALASRGLPVIIATHDPKVRDACTRTIDLAAA